MQTKELLTVLISELVDFPAEVVVEEFDGDFGEIFQVKLNKEDIGKVVGKKGKTVSALRQLFKSIARKSGKSFELEIVE